MVVLQHDPGVGAELLPEREHKSDLQPVSIETAGSAPSDLQIQVGVIANRIKIAGFPDNEV